MSTCYINYTFSKAMIYGLNSVFGSGVNIKVYKGTIPTTAVTYSATPSVYDSDLLATWTNSSFVYNFPSFQLNTVTATTVNASQTGTATWAAWYKTATPTYVVITDVGLIGSAAPTVLSSLSLVQDTPITLIDIGLKVNTPY